MHQLITDGIFSEAELFEVIKELKRDSLHTSGSLHFKIRAFTQEDKIWEYGYLGSQLSLDGNSPYFSKVIDAFEISGASKVNTNFSDESLKTDNTDWSDWFLKKAANKYLIPDTNFIFRHYSSGTLLFHLNKKMNELTFKLPRVVVLEIERRGNSKKKQEQTEKRLAFYAAREIQFLRNHTKFEMIPQSDSELITSFTERAGRGFADMWIRQEIHDAIDKGFYDKKYVLFLTSDLMNAMSAEAEGIDTCYFSRLPQDSYSLGDSQSILAKFLVANAVIFGTIKLELILNNEHVSDVILVKGAWSGKTTSEWYNDCVKIRH